MPLEPMFPNGKRPKRCNAAPDPKKTVDFSLGDSLLVGFLVNAAELDLFRFHIPVINDR